MAGQSSLKPVAILKLNNKVGVVDHASSLDRTFYAECCLDFYAPVFAASVVYMLDFIGLKE